MKSEKAHLDTKRRIKIHSQVIAIHPNVQINETKRKERIKSFFFKNLPSAVVATQDVAVFGTQDKSVTFQRYICSAVGYAKLHSTLYSGLKGAGGPSYRVVFLTGPPDFQYQNEKQVAQD